MIIENYSSTWIDDNICKLCKKGKDGNCYTKNCSCKVAIIIYDENEIFDEVYIANVKGV